MNGILLLETYIAGLFAHDPDTVKSLAAGMALELRRERENEHDRRAIAVHIPGGERVGYVPRHENETLSRLMDAGKALEATIYDIHYIGQRVAAELHVSLVENVESAARAA